MTIVGGDVSVGRPLDSETTVGFDSRVVGVNILGNIDYRMGLVAKPGGTAVLTLAGITQPQIVKRALVAIAPIDDKRASAFGDFRRLILECAGVYVHH